MLNRQYLRGIWQFYCCVNLSLAVLRLNGVNRDESFLKERNSAWRRWLSNGHLFNKKKFKLIRGYMQEDMSIIIEALGLIEKINKEKQFEFSQFDPVGSSFVGCVSYEFPSE